MQQWYNVLTTLLVSLVLVTGTGQLHAQGCCAGGVPVSGNLGLPASEKGAVQLQLTLDHNHLDALFTGRHRLEDATRLRTTSSVLLEGSYGISERFTLSSLWSFVRQTRTITPASGAIDFTANAGLGDAIFLLRYKLLTSAQAARTDLVVGLGPKLPLGRTDYRDARGIVLPADLQPGTGAWDAMAWAYFSHTGWLRPSFGFKAILSYQRTGTNQRYNGSQAYRFGNEIQLNFGFSDRITTSRVMLDPLLMFRLRATTPDQAEGATVSNTGGQWLHALPGVALGLSPQLTLRFNAEIPVYRNLTGTQLTTRYRATMAVYYTFSPAKSATSILKNIHP